MVDLPPLPADGATNWGGPVRTFMQAAADIADASATSAEDSATAAAASALEAQGPTDEAVDAGILRADIPAQITAEIGGPLAPVALSGAYADLSGKPTIPTIPVTSVASKTGAVSLVKGDVGLGNVDNTSDANKPVSTAMATALAQITMGNPGVKYKIVAGTIRNVAGTWALVDGAHTGINVQAVSSDANFVYIDYDSIGATSVVSFVVGPDETLAGEGFVTGSSVALTRASISLRKTTPYADYVSYNGTSWVSANGVFTGLTYTAGALSLTHKAFPVEAGGTQFWDVGVTGRGDSLASSHGATASTCLVRFYNYGGTLLTTAATTMKAFVTHGMSGNADPREVTTALYPNSNLWFIGIFVV